MRPFRVILFLCAALSTATIQAAGFADDGALAETSNFSIAPPQDKASEYKLSLEFILNEIQRQLGWSFIFDSRVIKGKTLKPIDEPAGLEKVLAKRLAETGLVLNRVSGNTFVITAAISENDLEKIESPEPEPLNDVILVTSSAATSSAAFRSSKLFELDERYLDYFNIAAPDRAIHDLPQTLASVTPTTTILRGADAGISLPDIRGFGFNRSMVLVNGRPVTPTLGSSLITIGVDMNRLSTPFLERVEVQTTPGSARHGTGASAGVINFVLRTEQKGLEVGSHYGLSERGDAEDLSLHAIGGFDIGHDANITFGFNHSQISGLIGSDREATSSVFGFDPGAQFLPNLGGSPITDAGAISGVILSDNTVALFPNGATFIPDNSGALTQFTRAPDQLFNQTAQLSMTPSIDRYLGYFSFSSHPSSSVRVYVEGHGGVTSTNFQFAPIPSQRGIGVDVNAGDAAVIPIGNPTIPESISSFVRDSFGDNVQSILFDHRFAELGPRRSEVNRYFADFTLGVDVSGANGDLYTASYRYGRTSADWIRRKRIDRDKLLTALSVDACGQVAGCDLVDFFTPAGISAEAQKFITAPDIKSQHKLEEHEISFGAENSLRDILQDDINTRLSASFKNSSFSRTKSSELELDVIGTFVDLASGGSLKEYDFYAGGDFPLYRSNGWIGAIDISTEFRLSLSSVYDATTNVQSAAIWRPNKLVQFSFQHSVGHRTPNIVELFTADQTIAAGILDPCGLPPEQSTQIIIDNCISDSRLGVKPGFVQDDTLTQLSFYGNPRLEPEDVRFHAFGVALQPTEVLFFIPGDLNIAATWQSFDFKNTIINAHDNLVQCYTSIQFTSDACGINPLSGNPTILRDPVTQQISLVENFATNRGDTSWRGLDIDVQYEFEPGNNGLIDRFWLNGLHTYTHMFQRFEGQNNTVEFVGLADIPRHLSIVSAGIDRGPVDLAFLLKRRGQVSTAMANIPEAKIPAVVYLDATLRIDVSRNAYVQFGVENLFDRDPPIAAFIPNNNTLPNFYDIVGRKYTLASRVRF